MKFSKLGLLTLLISLFILNSCKNQDEIGLGVDAGNQLNGSFIADTSLTMTTVPEDTVITSGLVRTPLSYFKDPEFGTSESSIAAQLTLPNNAAFTLPTGTLTIDSVRLVLPYSPTGGFYGDSLASRFKVNVHQLNERVSSSINYYNNKEWSFNTTPLGTLSFAARSRDSIRIFNILKGRSDTLRKVRPQIRIPINPDFVDGYLLGDAPAVNRSTPVAFQNAVRGLYITLDKSATTGPGGTMMFQMDSVRMQVYYRATSGTTVDTNSFALPITNTRHAANIKHSFSAKVQAALNGTGTDNMVYLSGLAGTRAKLTFPNVKNIFAGLGDVVINRAELVVTANPSTVIPYAPAQRIGIYTSDLARQRIRIPDLSTIDPRGQYGNTATLPPGFYNKANNEYHILITAFLQDLYRGKSVDYGTYLSIIDPSFNPTSPGPISISATPQYAERIVAVGKRSPYRVRLNIIYTKINP